MSDASQAAREDERRMSQNSVTTVRSGQTSTGLRFQRIEPNPDAGHARYDRRTDHRGPYKV